MYDVDLHCGSCSNGVGFYVEDCGVVIFCYQTPKKIVLNDDPVYHQKVQKLFEQPEFSEGDEDSGQVTLKRLEIREIPPGDPVLTLIERVRSFLQEQEDLTAQILSCFPGATA